MNTHEIISKTIVAILLERGAAAPELKPETRISASGLDSLDIAVLVVRLEERFGVDPFSLKTLDRYPQTLGELAAMYPGHDI